MRISSSKVLLGAVGMMIPAVSLLMGESGEDRSHATLFEGPLQGGVNVRVQLDLQRYPLLRGKDPAFELIVNPPVTTRKIRFVSRDGTAHVTEIRLFEAGMPEYPPVMGGGEGGLDLPNLARGAQVTASSRWAAERHERQVVDDDLGFDSRWVSRGGPPHSLVLELTGTHSIGCIQMVSGYPVGNEWTAAGEDFFFEYERNGEWHSVPGSGGDLATEPSRLALVLGDGRRTYRFIHRQESVNWVVERTGEGEEGERLAAFSLGQENLREGERYAIGLMVTPKAATLILDGKALFQIDHSLGKEIRIGLEGLSSAVRFVADSGVEAQDPPRASATPGKVGLTDSSGRTLDFVFNPLEKRQTFFLPGRLSQVRVMAEPSIEGQGITIDDLRGNSREIELGAGKDRPVRLKVESADGSKEEIYEIVLASVPPSDRFELAFSDEFTGEQLDRSKWHYRLGSRWNSHQRPENAVVRDGRFVSVLEIDERGRQFTGGIITNEAFGYGYYETSARLWKHRGWHSAFWQMQASGVRVNEIDGFESVSPNSFSTNLQHYRPRNILGAKEHRFDVAGGFNTFAWEWLPDRVRFFFNGELIRDDPYPGPHLPQHVWLGSVARQDASTEGLPGAVEFEYFRYYRLVDEVQPTEDAIIVDIRSSGYLESGDWEEAEYAVSHRHDFKTRVSRTPGSEAKWETELPAPGSYEVFVWNPYIFPDGNHSLMRFFIAHSGTKREATINPMRAGQRWVSLGVYSFYDDTSVKVGTVVAGNRDHRVDAVMFVPIDRP